MKPNIFAVTFFLTLSLFAQTDSPFYVDSLQTKWVDEVYNQMTLEEKVGQLFMVAAYSNKDAAHENFIEKLVEEEHIGGLIFMQDQPIHQVELTNRYQSKAKIPLLIAMDAEWDVSMRLKNTNKFPWAMTLGAISNDDLIYQMGQSVAGHAKRLGVHMNFAPVVDVNTNPKNPIIGNRSFGSDVENVGRKGVAYARGMQDSGVLASAKHFPGHGDTDKDSHKTLPTVSHNKQRLDEIELRPFQTLIDANVASVMVAHLNVPTLESNPKYPSSLSNKVIIDLLKKQMGFKGLVITDALNMKAVANAFSPGEVDLKAFEAGNDILLFSQAVKTGKQKIIDAFNSGKITEERLAESVKKILMAKYSVGLKEFSPIALDGLMDDLNDAKAKALNHELYENAMTLVKNDENLLPIQNLNDKKIAFVPLEKGDHNTFYTYLRKYTKVDLVRVTSSSQVAKLNDYDLVIVGVNKSTKTPYKSYKISSISKGIISAIAQKKPTVLSLFTSPYGLKDLDASNVNSVIVAYQNNKETQQIVPQIIFGAIPAKGVLPADVNSTIKAGQGVQTEAISRLGYTLPENVNVDSKALVKIDQLANEAILAKATPGIQIIAAKNGKVFYDKTFGYHTYDQKKKVNWNDVYDVASVTKITSTLPLIMQEVSQGKLSVDQTLGEILPKAKNTNKENIKLRDMLAHKAGLEAWIGFYKESVNIKNARLYLDYYSRTQSDEFPIKVDERIYLIKSFKDSIRAKIYDSKLGSKKYKYSDLGYYLLQDYLEAKHKTTLDKQVQTEFYRPMGMNYTTYNAIEYFNLDQIIPTEKDKIFRNKLIHGYVHDQGAAMQGGVAGHAGVFSNANDMAKMMQMYLNGGYYGGTQFVSADVLDEFTKYQFKEEKNRRGIGFDKQQLTKHGPTCNCTSTLSFGHTGFTGTMVWADPDAELVYVFLSNRIHPDVDNRKLIKKNTRSKIQGVLYDAIDETDSDVVVN